MLKKCICTIINDDHQYLKEWVDYHLSIGFDHIFLYEVEESRSHKILLSEYTNITIEQVEKLNLNIENNFVHKFVYNWFIDNYKDKYDWCLFLDNIDSFFIIDKNLDEFLEQHNQYESLLIRWKLFNASGRTSIPLTGTVIENYKNQFYEFDYINEGHIYNVFVNLYCLYIKDIETKFNSKFTNFFNNSYDIYTETLLTTEDKIKKEKVNIIYPCINTYFTKSWVDWCNKIYKYINTKEKLIKNVNMSLDTFFIYNSDLEMYDEVFINQQIYCSHYNQIHNNIYYILSYKYNKNLTDNIKFMNNMFSEGIEKLIDSPELEKNKNITDKKIAVIFLSNSVNEISIQRYSLLEFTLSQSTYDLYWAISNEKTDNLINGVNYYIFDKNKLIENYGRAFYGKGTSLFNVNFVVQDFYENNSKYDYIWCIEYDVILSNNDWFAFFNYFDKSSDADLLSSNIENSGYAFFHYTGMLNDTNFYTNNLFKEKIQSFNPVFRISARALNKLIEYYKLGNSGYYEVIMPSIINLYQYKLEDFGGNGKYVKKENLNKWYIRTSTNNGTFGFMPYNKEILTNLLKKLNRINKPTLIHPVKILLNK